MKDGLGSRGGAESAYKMLAMVNLQGLAVVRLPSDVGASGGGRLARTAQARTYLGLAAALSIRMSKLFFNSDDTVA